jgi:hypothetical protein
MRRWGRPTNELSATSTPSAANLGSQIKSHKRKAWLALAALIAVTATVSYFAYWRYASDSGQGAPARSPYCPL